MRTFMGLLALCVLAGCGVGDMAPSQRAPGPEPHISTLFRPSKTAQPSESRERYLLPEFPDLGKTPNEEIQEWLEPWKKQLLSAVKRTLASFPKCPSGKELNAVSRL